MDVHLSPPVGLAEALAVWAGGARRDLPWRRTRDPWAVLVSEVMLQQTQAVRVAPRFVAWMARWPDAAALAVAPIGEVIAAWSGLGYNRRALRLHRCAGEVTRDHGGVVPDRLDALLALPGIGGYTARAILAFAYERPVGVVDVNAARVLARAEAGRPLRASEAQRLADAVVPPARSWAHNQAMLDLGATVCVARRPACHRCPLAAARTCAWRRAGGGPDPAIGSAGTGRTQPPFAGSDRQGRGRLVAALAPGPIAVDDLAAVAGWSEDPVRAKRIVATLVADGLARRTDDGGLAYPTAAGLVAPGPSAPAA